MTTRRPVVRLRENRMSRRPDTLAVEEPLIVRVGTATLTMTMRTPGDDFDLVAGWLVSEGAIRGASQLVGMRMCPDEDNAVEVTLGPGVAPPAPRAFTTTSACGVCGADSIADVRTAMPWPVDQDPLVLTPDLVAELPDRLRASQRVFERTGGLHAAGLFAADGTLVLIREDVGRHNAVDKVVGAALRAGMLPLTGHILQVSGRASFELVHKAVMAGIPALSAISAPSSLAVDLAADCGLTLMGFVRATSMNVYSRADRLKQGSA